MRIEINPRTLRNLENICEVLYKLHPSVLDYLIDMERTLGHVLGFNDMNNLNLEQREFFYNLNEIINDKDYDNDDKVKTSLGQINKNILDEIQVKRYFNKIKELDLQKNKEELISIIKNIERETEDKNTFNFLKKYIQLDTYEYIPMKIYVEVEDHVIGKKVRELVRTLEKTSAPEQFYLNKREIDYDAYFSEGYNLSMNDEQKKKMNDLFDNYDVEGLEDLLKKENLYA